MSLCERGPGSELQYQKTDQPHCLIVGLFPALDRTAPIREAWEKDQSLDKFLLSLPSRGSMEMMEPGYPVKLFRSPCLIILTPLHVEAQAVSLIPQFHFIVKQLQWATAQPLIIPENLVQKPHGSKDDAGCRKNKCHDGLWSACL